VDYLILFYAYDTGFGICGNIPKYRVIPFSTTCGFTTVTVVLPLTAKGHPFMARTFYSSCQMTDSSQVSQFSK